MRGILLCALSFAAAAAENGRLEYRVLATSKTSTMEKEMNEAAANGFVFSAVMGGDTAAGGKEVVVVMAKSNAGETSKRTYRLLAARKTSTLEKELQELGGDGYDYKGQTVFESAFAGREVAVILERDAAKAAGPVQYRLLAANRTSTMEKELREAGETGFVLLGMTVGKTAFGGSEILCILSRR